MAIQDNYYEIALRGGDIIFSPKASTQIESSFVQVKKGIVVTKITDTAIGKEVIGEPPLITLTLPYQQIAFIKEFIGNYEEASKI